MAPSLPPLTTSTTISNTITFTIATITVTTTTITITTATASAASTTNITIITTATTITTTTTVVNITTTTTIVAPSTSLLPPPSLLHHYYTITTITTTTTAHHCYHHHQYHHHHHQHHYHYHHRHRHYHQLHHHHHHDHHRYYYHHFRHHQHHHYHRYHHRHNNHHHHHYRHYHHHPYYHYNHHRHHHHCHHRYYYRHYHHCRHHHCHHRQRHRYHPLPPPPYHHHSHNQLYQDVVKAIANCRRSAGLSQEILYVLEKELFLFDDVRFYTLQFLQVAIEERKKEQTAPPNKDEGIKRGQKRRKVSKKTPPSATTDQQTKAEEGGGAFCGIALFCHNVYDILAAVHMPAHNTTTGKQKTPPPLTVFLVEPPPSDHTDNDGEEMNQLSDSDDDDVDEEKKKKKQVLDMITDITDGTGFQREEKKPDPSTAYTLGQRKLAKVQSVDQHRKVFSKCWIAFLKLPLPRPIYKKVLMRMRSDIIPSLTQPLLLSGFLSDSFAQGGITGVLSLEGIFTLMTQYRLEYKNFFEQLYSLLTPQIMFARRRERLFTLMAACLSSITLPTYLVASFCKRLSRLALSSPPSSTLFIIALVFNSMAQHVGCRQMVNRQPSQDGMLQDPFRMDEPDMKKNRALESSLWELRALKMHYEPSIAKLAEIFDMGFERGKLELRDFSSLTYKSLFDEHVQRKKSKAVAVTFVSPKDVFRDDSTNRFLILKRPASLV